MKSYSNLDVLGMEGIQMKTAGDLHLKTPDIILTSLVSFSCHVIIRDYLTAFWLSPSVSTGDPMMMGSRVDTE